MAYNVFSRELIGAPEPARLEGEVVSASYFDVMGVRPLVGRAFVPGEDDSGAGPVIVLSHRTWQGPFHGDPEILGQTIRIDDVLFTVIGVAGPSFHGSFEREH